MKRQLTSEQLKARDDRRAKFRALWQQVAKLDVVQRAEMAARYGFRTCEGHSFSMCNTLMIAFQGGGSVFGGFRQWQKFGRAVRKGEHGRCIFIPMGHKAADPATGETTTVMDQKKFGTAYVFDIAQTDELAVGTGNQECVVAQ
jgi:hypothetical protein